MGAGSVGFTFSPDGKEVCYVSNPTPNLEAVNTNKDLWIVNSAGGTPKDITADNQAYDGNPQYSPDGKYIAYKTQKIPAYESDLFLIALYNRATGEKTILTDKFDNWENDIQWSADSKTIYFTAQHEGHTPLYKIDIATKKIDKILDGRPSTLSRSCPITKRSSSPAVQSASPQKCGRPLLTERM